jgi:hypothetical protein
MQVILKVLNYRQEEHEIILSVIEDIKELKKLLREIR